MSRKYYKHYNHYRKNNVLALSRSEREALNLLSGLIKTIIFIIVELSRGIYEIFKYIRKIAINFYALKKIGYDLNNILDMLYEISPRQFEIFIAELYKQHGHKVRLTVPSNDYGRDIVVDNYIFIECKRYSKDGQKIGREICQKLLGSMQMLNAEKGIIITTGTFHKNAYEVASMVDNLILMDMGDIEKMILDLKPEQIAKVIMRTKNCA